MTQPKALILDEIIKIYKNADDKVLGIHSIVVHEDRQAIPDPRPGKVNSDRFKRTARTTHSFSRINLEMGGDRTISKVLMIGKYDDFDYNGDNTDVISVTYLGDDHTNDVYVDISQFPTIGDVL